MFFSISTPLKLIMKSYFFVLLFFLCITFETLNAQTPQAIPYQAVARDMTGNPYIGQAIMLRFSIHDVSTGGTIVYSETQPATTNTLGLFNVNIGQGTPVTGTFSAINWGTNAKFMQVELDITGTGTSYTNMGTQQLLSVPYAIFSEKSANLPDGTANGNTLRWNGSAWIADDVLTNTGSNVGIGTATPNTSSTLDLSSTTKGFLMPRMTTAQRNAIASPAIGLQIFNIDDLCTDIYDGTNWIKNCGLKVTGTVAGPTGNGSNEWVQKTNLTGIARAAAVGFSIGDKGYIGTGNDVNLNYLNDFWEYNSLTNSWTQKANFPGGARHYATGFSIDGKGYLGTGNGNSGYYNDFWEYNPINNTWLIRASFPGGARMSAVGMTIGNKGYVGCGNTGLTDFWEFDPILNSWSAKANVPISSPNQFGAGFSIGNKGYMFVSFVQSPNPNFFEFDPLTNVWTQKASFIGTLGGGYRSSPVAFSILDRGYLGGGYNYSDFHEYNPALDEWIQKANLGGGNIDIPVSFVISGKGYYCTGRYFSLYKKELWQYSPSQQINAYSSIPNTLNNSSVNNGSWITFGNTIYNSNFGNIGIGTSSPTQKLDVAGTTRTTNFQMTTIPANGHVLKSDASGNASWVSPSTLGLGTVTNIATGTGLSGGPISGSGTISLANSGITAGTYTKLTVDATGRATTGTNLTAGDIPTGASGYIQSQTTTDQPAGLRINGDGLFNGGNVGIGTLTPSQKLEVNGNIKFTENGEISSFSNNHRILFRRFENKIEFREFGDIIFSPGATAGIETARMVFNANGNAGFGINSPQTKIHIDGGTDADFANTSGYLTIGNTGTTNLVFDDNEIMSRNNGAPSRLFLQNSGGNVGINSNAVEPLAALDVNGTVKFGSAGTVLAAVIKGTGTTSSLLIAANTTSVQTYAIPNSLTTASVLISPASAIAAGLVIAYARVSSPGTVEVAYRNTTGAGITLTAGTTLYITAIQ